MGAVSREEFEEWLLNPVTKRLKDQIKKDVTLMQDMLLDCHPDDLRELQGRCKSSLNLLDVAYEDLYE